MACPSGTVRPIRLGLDRARQALGGAPVGDAGAEGLPPPQPSPLRGDEGRQVGLAAAHNSPWITMGPKVQKLLAPWAMGKGSLAGGSGRIPVVSRAAAFAVFATAKQMFQILRSQRVGPNRSMKLGGRSSLT